MSAPTSPTSPGEPTSAAARLCVWLNELRIRTLNVAGNRAGQAPGIAALATAVLERALGDIEDESRARGVRQRSVLLDAMASYRKWQLIAVVRAGSGAVHKSWAWAAALNRNATIVAEPRRRPKSARRRDAGGDSRTTARPSPEAGSGTMLSESVMGGKL